MNKFLAAAALATGLLTGLPAVAQQKLVPAQSEIGFTSPVDGKFRRFDAQVAFDPKNLAAAKIGVTVDLASVQFGTPEFDAEAAKPDFFNTKAFPQATFQSTSVKALGGGKFEVAGKFSLKGTTKDVLVPVALTQAGGTTTATGTFAIKRLDHRIGEGDWKDTSLLGNNVQIKFKLALTGVAPL